MPEYANSGKLKATVVSNGWAKSKMDMVTLAW